MIFTADTFTGTDGTSITAHTGETGATWAFHPGFPGGAMVLASNRLRANTATNGVIYASGVPGSADYDVTVTMRFLSGGTGFAGPCARVSTSASDFYCAFYSVSGGWSLYWFTTAGGLGSLGGASDTMTPDQDYTVTLSCSGTTIRLIVDGVTLITATDSRVTAAGRAGILTGGSATDSTGIHFGDITTSGGDPVDITPGSITHTSASSTTVVLTSAAATGGTAPYTYQWYKSATSGFTPWGGNIISGATGLTLTDASADSSGYWYKLVVTDDAATTVTAPQVFAAAAPRDVIIGFVGDSITAGHGVATVPGILAAENLRQWGYGNITALTSAAGGSATSDWVAGSANMTTAEAALSSASIIVITLGVNDAGAGTSAATFGANLANCAARWVSLGKTVVLNYPTGMSPLGSYGEPGLAAEETYQAAVDALVNGSTILQGSTYTFDFFASDPSLLDDGIHMTEEGNAALGVLMAIPLISAIVPGEGGSGGAGINGSEILGIL